jgi:hypothetical protein
LEDDTDAGQLEVRLTLLQENWNKFNEIQDELDSLEKERTEIENRYCFLLSFIQGRLKDVQSRQSNIVPTEPVVQVKLPQLSLPHFNGNISEWVTFKETFLSLVGNNATISNVHKFHYLLSAVNGDAKRVVQHIPLNADGYDIPWSLLTERYQNEKLIVNTHIANIMKQPTILTENVSQLRQLIDITKSKLKALDSMDQQTNTWTCRETH